MRAFVAEERAIDTRLFRDGVVNELAPNKDGCRVVGPEHDCLAGTDKLLAGTLAFGRAVVTSVQFKA